MGLNNVADPMRGTGTGTDAALTWEWQSVADNVNGTDDGGLSLREGYALSAAGASITASFSTFDYARLYIIDAGSLKRVNTDGSTATLYGVLSGTAFWSELNDIVYLSCGADKLEIHADGSVLRWGVPTPTEPSATPTTGSLFAGVVQIALTYTDVTRREGGASPAVSVTVAAGGGVTVSNIPQLAGYTAHLYMTEPDGSVFYHIGAVPSSHTALTITSLPLGPELTTQFLDEVPPAATYLAALGANLYAAEYIPELDQTVVWFSEALGYHLFNLNSNYFVVSGEVTQMHGSPAGLVVATHNRVFFYSDDKLQQVAEYGAVPGRHADIGSDGRVYLWTKRGLCRTAPFENLTDTRISVAPGMYAGGGIVEKSGYRKYIAVLHQGGSPFNRR